MVEPYHAFPEPTQDKFLGLILALGAEVWVLRDRLTLLEKALSTKGIQVSQIIDELANRSERVAEMERDRSAFMERFLRILTQEAK